MRIPLILAPAALFFAGCRVELPPVETAFVAHAHVTIDSPDKQELSRSQIEALAGWFGRQQSGWQYEISDFAPDTWLLFKHPKGKVSWVYLNGNEIWVRSKMKLLTADARAELRDILQE